MTILAAGLLSLIACGTAKKVTNEAEVNSSAKESITEKAMLKFDLSDYAGFYEVTTLEGFDFMEDKKPYFSIKEDGGVFGNTGCNSFFGNINPNSDSVILASVGMTRMACMGNRNTIESLFVGYLNKADNMSKEQGKVYFQVGNERPISAIEISLRGRFYVPSYKGKKSGERKMWFEISEGKIAGNTGCNSFFGEMSQEAYKLKIQNIGATEAACEDFDMNRETSFMKDLSVVSGYKTQGNETHFLDSSGAVLFVAMSGNDSEE